MTKTVPMHTAAHALVSRQLQARALLHKLTRIIALLLAVAFCLTVLLEVSKGIPFFYSVTETSVTVTAGDTLWGIAEEHIGEYPGGIRSYLAEICRRNGLTGIDTIHAGTVLYLPIYSYRLA